MQGRVHSPPTWWWPKAIFRPAVEDRLPRLPHTAHWACVGAPVTTSHRTVTPDSTGRRDFIMTLGWGQGEPQAGQRPWARLAARPRAHELSGSPQSRPFHGPLPA